jgi:uncharacterized membrane protein
MDLHAQRRSDGFRERGHQVTRIEAFVDAAFAFAVTLLVIAVGEVPDTTDEMIAALKQVPAFACSFALIALFWTRHNTWSRRYGLDDTATTLLSLLLVFQVLVYVYPLRMLFGGFAIWISGGWLGGGFQPTRPADVAIMFMIYAIAWITMCTNILLLYRHAWRTRRQTGLDLDEQVSTRSEIAAWTFAPLVGVASFALALWLREEPDVPGWVIGMPGMLYGLMGLTYPVALWYGNRERVRLVAEVGDPAPRTRPLRRRRRRRAPPDVA